MAVNGIPSSVFIRITFRATSCPFILHKSRKTADKIKLITNRDQLTYVLFAKKKHYQYKLLLTTIKVVTNVYVCFTQYCSKLLFLLIGIRKLAEDALTCWCLCTQMQTLLLPASPDSSRTEQLQIPDLLSVINTCPSGVKLCAIIFPLNIMWLISWPRWTGPACWLLSKGHCCCVLVGLGGVQPAVCGTSEAETQGGRNRTAPDLPENTDTATS